jgi:hypothetical protein
MNEYNELLFQMKELPWECSEEQSIVAEELMEKILSLSLNESSFSEEPIPPTCFDFDMEAHVQVLNAFFFCYIPVFQIKLS